jgi:hydroxyacylglutathione hydrolase
MDKFNINHFICRSDNYGVIISDKNTGLTASIDAPDAEIIDQELKRNDLKLTHLFITHKHLDHIEGIEYLKDKYGCTVIGPEKEKDEIRLLDITVIDEEYIDFSGSPIKIIATPGHTLGHIIYYFEQDNLLFAGDTLFLMGCGRVFEGTHKQMFESLEKIKKLPPDTTIYCGHEYSLANAKFAASIWPDKHIKKRLDEIELLRAQNKHTIPTTLDDELTTNLFLMSDNIPLKRKLNMGDAKEEEIFSELRTKKDNF